MKTGKTAFCIFNFLILSGCAMKEFSSSPLYSGNEVKFTGAVEDRVNLWPVAYWRDPVGSLAWPLISWGDDHFAFRPLYSQYKQKGENYNEFNFLWPICQFDTLHCDNRIFPFFWGEDCGSDPYFCMFPLLWYNDEFAGAMPFFWARDRNNGGGFSVFPFFWSEWTSSGSLWHSIWPLYYYESNEANGRTSSSSELWAACYLAGYERYDGKFTSHRILPFYFWEQGDFYSLPYSRYNEGNMRKRRILCGLAGMDSHPGGEYEASWAFPFFYHDKDEFITPLFGMTKNKSWLIPLYYHDKDLTLTPLFGKTAEANWAFPLYYKDKSTFLTLLYGHDSNNRWLLPFYFDGPESTYITPFYGMDKKSGADWLFPLYYRDDKSFITPVFGKSGDSSWILPFYCRNKSQFNSPFLSYWDDAEKGERGFFSLPLLSGASWETNSCDKTWFTLAGLVGAASDATGRFQSEWALPLFFREKGQSFYSLPYGWNGGGSACTNTYFAAGLAGVKSGKTEGGWLFPIFCHEKDADYDIKKPWMDLAKLPEDIKVWTEIKTNMEWNAQNLDWEETARPQQCATYISAHDNKSHLLVSHNNRSLEGNFVYGSTNRYEMVENSKIGNLLVFNHESTRKTGFDTETRDKVSDSEESETSLLLFLYNGQHRADRMNGTSYESHRVLWKLWDWEKENGDVSLDIFPGFTYDSKKNGYSKTSFLWRFFRYENDPNEGKKADFLFIPVLRSNR